MNYQLLFLFFWTIPFALTTTDVIGEPQIIGNYVIIQRKDNATGEMIEEVVRIWQPEEDETTTTPKPPIVTSAPCPKEYRGVEVCRGLIGDLAQLRNGSCWYTRPITVEKSVVMTKMILYSTLVIICCVGNFYIMLAVCCDWYCSSRPMCHALAGIALVDLLTLGTLYSEDVLSSSTEPLVGLWPAGEIACALKEMILNFSIPAGVFFIALIFYERCRETRILYKMAPMEYVASLSPASSPPVSPGVLSQGFIWPSELPEVVEEEDEEPQRCCSGGGEGLVRPQFMRSLMFIASIVAFVRSVTFTSLMKFDQCPLGDGTLYTTCEPDNLEGWPRIAMYLGDLALTYVGSIIVVFVCSKRVIFTLVPAPASKGPYLPHDHRQRIRIFQMCLCLGAMSMMCLLPHRIAYLFVKSTKYPLDPTASMYTRLLLYINCAFKPLLYALLYREIYQPLCLWVTGGQDLREGYAEHSRRKAEFKQLRQEAREWRKKRKEKRSDRTTTDDTCPELTQEEYIEKIRQEVKQRKESERGSMDSGLSFNRTLSDQPYPYLMAPPHPQFSYHSLSRSSSYQPSAHSPGRPKLHSVSGVMDEYPGMMNPYASLNRGGARSNYQNSLPRVLHNQSYGPRRPGHHHPGSHGSRSGYSRQFSNGSLSGSVSDSQARVGRSSRTLTNNSPQASNDHLRVSPRKHKRHTPRRHDSNSSTPTPREVTAAVTVETPPIPMQNNDCDNPKTTQRLDSTTSDYFSRTSSNGSTSSAGSVSDSTVKNSDSTVLNSRRQDKAPPPKTPSPPLQSPSIPETIAEHEAFNFPPVNVTSSNC